MSEASTIATEMLVNRGAKSRSQTLVLNHTMALAKRSITIRKILPEPFERCSLEFAPPPDVKTNVVLLLHEPDTLAKLFTARVLHSE